jgi:hypothetical protein
MVSPKNLILSAARLIFAASVAIASPINIEGEVLPTALGSEAFRISQVYNPAYSAFGPAAYAKALQKYNVALPQELINAIPILAGAAATDGESQRVNTVYGTNLPQTRS